MLEWRDEESKGEPFTLVQSKKKKKVITQLKNLVKVEHDRGSKRIVPSVYRNNGSQENIEPKKRNAK
jgi:hypothetical protein